MNRAREREKVRALAHSARVFVKELGETNIAIAIRDLADAVEKLADVSEDQEWHES